ncbi:MAG: alkaline phosphatase family protein [Candidatus Bipolaricaulota bacterium]
MNIFLFGIDGASPDLINKWIDEGELKNLAKIKSQGLSGKLESTFPPLTGPAWSSFQTGVNPGKHGVYNWLDLSSSYKGKLINRNSIKTKTIWNQISSNGGRIGLVSVPVTYPPEKVNGVIIPGFLTPSSAPDSTYPNNLSSELYERVPDFKYTLEPLVMSDNPKHWVSGLKKAVRDRGSAARYLYKNYFNETSKEVFMTHFIETDRVQHFLWNDGTDDYDPRLEVFKQVDVEIGKTINLAPDDSVFIVLSDHGFGSFKYTFNVNNWLKSENYLTLSQTIKTKTKQGISKLGFTEQNMRSFGEILYGLAKRLKLLENPTMGLSTSDALNSIFLSLNDINWKGTIAYSRSDIGNIRLNLSGREKEGVVREDNYHNVRKEIMRRLSGLKVTGTNKNAVDWVKPKEEIYSGPFLGNAPDILFNSLEGKNCHGSIVGYGARMFFHSSIFSKKFNPGGHHRRDGILMACGKGIGQAERDASLLDLAPTILNLNSFEIPKQMDGKVIKEIAPEDPQYYEPEDFYKESVKSDQNEEIERRLENLGYL